MSVRSLTPKLPPISSPFRELGDSWRLTLREAIRIGLTNSQNLLKVEPPPDGKFVISFPIANDSEDSRWKAETMAVLRSIEQQYWTLCQQRDQKWAVQKAVDMAEEIQKRAKALVEVGQGPKDDLAEAQQRLEQFRLDLESSRPPTSSPPSGNSAD